MASRPRVAIAAYRAFAGAEATDIYPDPDWPLLAAALVEAGVDAMSISWDHEALDWQRFDLVVTNSTWDSVDRPQGSRRSSLSPGCVAVSGGNAPASTVDA